MPLAMYDATPAPVPQEPIHYRIGYDTKTGAIYVMSGANTLAYLAPRESREIAQNILAVGKT